MLYSESNIICLNIFSISEIIREDIKKSETLRKLIPHSFDSDISWFPKTQINIPGYQRSKLKKLTGELPDREINKEIIAYD